MFILYSLLFCLGGKSPHLNRGQLGKWCKNDNMGRVEKNSPRKIHETPNLLSISSELRVVKQYVSLKIRSNAYTYLANSLALIFTL